ncbi:MAG TPA: hypothetical protein VGB01_07835, partial [candidate division Zixibacteria bacterium]
SKKPAGDYANEVEQECFRNGLMILTCGPNSVRLIPPLIIDEEIADKGLKIFEKVVKNVSGKKKIIAGVKKQLSIEKTYLL